MAGYAKLSNGFWQDKDVAKLRRRNPSATMLFVLAISWCSDHATDGRIDTDTMLYVLNADEQDVGDLKTSGLIVADEDGESYTLRSYLKYQNSAEQIEQAKEKERDKKRRQRGAKQDNSTVPPVSQKVPENVPDVSPRDNSTVPPVSFNQEPITNNQKNSSNEEFSLPQTPSQAEGASESADEEYPIEFRQFWDTYPRHTGKRKAFQAWRKARRKTNNTFLIAKASLYAADPNREPGYTLTPANWLDGEHWDDDPLPAKPKPGEPDAEDEHRRRLNDVDWLCSHVDDEECQRAALALSEKQQALARSKWPDEWYRLWRRAQALREREERERMETHA